MFAQRFFEPYVAAEQESEMRMHLTEKRAHPDSLAKLQKQIDCSSTNILSGHDYEICTCSDSIIWLFPLVGFHGTP